MAKKRKFKNVAEVELGKEPRNIDFTHSKDSDLGKALTYFSYRYDNKKAKEIQEERFNGIDFSKVKGLNFQPTISWLILLEKNNCILTEDLKNRIQKYEDDLRTKFPKTKEKIEVLKEKVGPFNDKQHLADFDDLIDLYFKDITHEEILEKFKSLLQTVSKTGVKDITNKVEELINEYQEINNYKDLQEGYKFLNKMQIKKIITFFTKISDFGNYILNKNKINTPRKKKVVPASKRIQHLKYKTKDEELMIVSINPEKILHSKSIWCFNTKSRDLINYRSKEGFDIKGTTLQNGEIAISKKIRKPETFLKVFTHSPRTKQDKDFSKIVGKEKSANFRINSDVVILSAYDL